MNIDAATATRFRHLVAFHVECRRLEATIEATTQRHREAAEHFADAARQLRAAVEPGQVVAVLVDDLSREDFAASIKSFTVVVEKERILVYEVTPLPLPTDAEASCQTSE